MLLTKNMQWHQDKLSTQLIHIAVPTVGALLHCSESANSLQEILQLSVYMIHQVESHAGVFCGP
jgi:hypothetical protein